MQTDNQPRKITIFMKMMPHQALPVWSGTDVPNQTVAFRTEFTLEILPEQPELLLAADTNVMAWCNGVEAGRGQYPDFPWLKSFTRISLAGKLKTGKNVLAVLAYHVGRDGFSTCMNSTPYMAAAVVDGEQILAVSSPEWRCNEETGWQNGPRALRSGQCCFSTAFDARILSGWTEPDHDDSDWKNAVVSCADLRWRERPVPPCRVGDAIDGTPVKYGTFKRKEDLPDIGRVMVNDQYFYTASMPVSAGDDDGVFAIFDLGKESCGFLTFEVEVPEGAVIDYAHGEHLDDGVVRALIYDRNFAERYIARAGINRHELVFHRCGLRYLQLNISNLNGAPVRIIRAGIRPWDYPLPEAAPFISDDLPSLNLRTVAQRTLELCMHEHYEDCVWREQSMYAYDSRNQALYGHYLWENYDFVDAAYQLLADSYPLGREEMHLMALCAPSTLKLSIPVFSFIWTSAARELYLYSGKRDLFDRNVEMIRDMTEDVFSRRDPATGLYHTGTGKKRWNFYEWSAGLDNWGREAAPGEYHAAYNLYLIEMLDNCAALTDGSEAERYAERADALRKAVHRNFWDAEKNAYATGLDNGVFGPHYHDHIQYLALRNKVVPDAEIQEKLTATLFAGTLIPATLSALPYLVDAVMPLSPEARTYAADLIRRTYGAMVEKGATTLWETAKGADDFGKAGSLCHGWSSLPVYYQGAEILGVRPLSPGFRTFVVRPYADRWTHFAEGEVPTPCGRIRIAWQKRTDGLHLKVHAPAGTDFTVESYPECPVVHVEKF